MARLILTPEGYVLETSTLQRTTLTFDEFILSDSGEQRIDTGYGGFSWTQAAVFNTDGNFGYTASSGENVAFIAEANGREIGGYDDASAGSPVIIARDEPFSIISANFSAAFRDGLVITVNAYGGIDGQEIIGQKTFTVDRFVATEIDFTTGLDFGTFANAGRIEINANDGNGDTSDYFGFDDLVFETGSVVTQPVTTLSFDDIPLGPNGEARIADGYQGFNWTQTAVFHQDSSPFGYAPSSGTNLAFIAEANSIEIPGYEDAATGSPVVISRGDAFTFLGASFSASLRDDLVITIRGYADEEGQVLVSEQSITADQNIAEQFTFLNSEFAGIRRLEFNANDGNAGTNDYFGFDDLLLLA